MWHGEARGAPSSPLRPHIDLHEIVVASTDRDSCLVVSSPACIVLFHVPNNAVTPGLCLL